MKEWLNESNNIPWSKYIYKIYSQYFILFPSTLYTILKYHKCEKRWYITKSEIEWIKGENWSEKENSRKVTYFRLVDVEIAWCSIEWSKEKKSTIIEAAAIGLHTTISKGKHKKNYIFI